MKLNRANIIYLFVLIAAASVYRIVDNRMLGFAPQIAMALFGGMAIRNNKTLAFGLPLFSLFISDVMYEILYTQGLSTIRGFYDGQILNYLIMGSVVLIGFLFRKVNVLNVIAGSLAAPVYFFIISNLVVWMGIPYNMYPKTWAGLVECFKQAEPFFRGSLVGTAFFSAIFFGVYYFTNKSQRIQRIAEVPAAA